MTNKPVLGVTGPDEWATHLNCVNESSALRNDGDPIVHERKSQVFTHDISSTAPKIAKPKPSLATWNGL